MPLRAKKGQRQKTSTYNKDIKETRNQYVNSRRHFRGFDSEGVYTCMT